MAMAHQPLAAVSGLSVGVAAEEGCDLRLDGLRQQGSRALAQNFGERVGERGWLDQLDDIILDHGVSLLRWRSGGSNTPTIRRLIPHAVTNFRAYLRTPGSQVQTASGPCSRRPWLGRRVQYTQASLRTTMEGRLRQDQRSLRIAETEPQQKNF